ncbi:hypothetical protein F8388_018522 [Cannabis sativa]|uniref:Uncharacterized protein n=1 Tax=Cannabis sativa TaxID=3483 RepID=A0A7J6G4L2_CANSA|nr:hypothetical protein F8388_018522 [Cannabis sativa]
MLAPSPLGRESGSLSATDMIDQIMLEKNGKTSEYFPGEVSTDRITAIQEAYWSMASALSKVDGIDYTDPEELELLITTLIDLDAMDGKSSVSLLAECSSSPDVNTRSSKHVRVDILLNICFCYNVNRSLFLANRKALANALSVAPSMWTSGL